MECVWKYHEEPGEGAVVAGEVEGEEEARDAAEGQELHEGAHAQLGQHERGEGRPGAHAVDEGGRAAAGDGAEAELVLQEERREGGEGRQDRRHAEEHARHQPVDQGQALQVLAHRPGREHPRIEQERHRRRGVGCCCCCCLGRRWWPHGEGRRGRSVGAAEAVAESADERRCRPTGCRGVDGGSDDASAALASDASAAFDGDVVPLLAAFARDDLRAALDTEVAPVLHVAHGGQRRAGGRRRQRKLRRGRRRCESGRRLRRGYSMAVGVGGVVQVEMMPTGVQGVVAVERAEVGGEVGEVRVVDHVMAAAAAAHASATSAGEEGVVSVGGRDVVVVGNCGVMAVGKETTAEAGVTVGGRQGQVAASRERRVGEVRLLGRGRG